VIGGIAAIPFVSVTLVAVVADVASTSDPAAGFKGLAALAAGLVMGILVLRVIAAVRAGVSIARIAVERMVDQAIAELVIPVCRLAPVVGDRRPHVAFVPSEIGRRGPPARMS
jgi:hypothetical protein